MIRFSLHCAQAHVFDAWFCSNDDYEKQRRGSLVSCPVCDSTDVEKMLMAPAVATARLHEQAAARREQAKTDMLKKLRQLTKSVRENADYVGGRFAEEARKIHFGEVGPRAIYGEANAQDVTSLLQDGIDILPLPRLPEDQN